MDILVLFLHFKEHCDSGSLIGFLIYLNHRGGSSKFHFRWNFFDVASIKALCKLRLWKTCGKREVGFPGFVAVVVCVEEAVCGSEVFTLFYQSWVCYTSFSKYKITVTGYMLHCSLYFLIHFIWLKILFDQHGVQTFGYRETNRYHIFSWEIFHFPTLS